jgi:hypothetical protein
MTTITGINQQQIASSKLFIHQTEEYITHVTQVHTNVFHVHVAINFEKLPCLPKNINWDKPHTPAVKDELCCINTSNLKEHGYTNHIFGVVSDDVKEVVGNQYDMFVFLIVQQGTTDPFSPSMGLSVHNDGSVVIHLDSKVLEFDNILKNHPAETSSIFPLPIVDKQVLLSLIDNDEDYEILESIRDQIGFIDVKRYYIGLLSSAVRETFVSIFSVGSQSFCFASMQVRIGKIVKQRMESNQPIDISWINQLLNNQADECLYPEDRFGFESALAIWYGIEQQGLPCLRPLKKFKSLSNDYVRHVYDDENIPNYFGNENNFETWIVKNCTMEARQRLLDSLLEWKQKLEQFAHTDLVDSREFVHAIQGLTKQ